MRACGWAILPESMSAARHFACYCRGPACLGQAPSRWPQHVPVLRGLVANKAQHYSAVAAAEPDVAAPEFVQQPLFGGDSRSKKGESIAELLQLAPETYKLNHDFWGKYADIPSMAFASEKGEILQIVEHFSLVRRKHIYLFQRLKNTVLAQLDLWSAPDLAVLCNSWASLGFLHEDLCVAMSARVALTAQECSPRQLCFLMDTYATARCSVHSVNAEIGRLTLERLDDFTLTQLCLHASSFARLNVYQPRLFDAIAARMVTLIAASGSKDVSELHARKTAPPGLSLRGLPYTARDLTFAAYAFGKLGFSPSGLLDSIGGAALEIVSDFTARDLQVLTVAFARSQYQNPELLNAVSEQAHRRVAQFNSESLVLMLRALAFFGMRESPLFTRTVAQLPRAILTFRPADVTTLLNAYASVQVHSLALFDVVTPYILEKASMFGTNDWLSALQSYSSLGHRDLMFLSALGLHLEASQLSTQQLCTAMLDCSRLSFTGASAALAEAALSQGLQQMDADTLALMYSALLLLGHSCERSPGDDAPRALLDALARQLGAGCVSASTLLPATCVNLAYASLLAPPLGAEEHPLATGPLVERSVAQLAALSSVEQSLLSSIRSGELGDLAVEASRRVWQQSFS